MQDAIVPTGIPGLSIVPADRRLASCDVLLADVPGREKFSKAASTNSVIVSTIS
jgi:hypothetical protein